MRAGPVLAGVLFFLGGGAWCLADDHADAEVVALVAVAHLLTFDQAPSLGYVFVGKHVGSAVFQIEGTLLGLRVMAIPAIGFQQGKHVLVVSCQVSVWLSD